MTGTLELKVTQHSIVKKYSKMSMGEKQAAVNALIDEILGGELPYDELEMKKKEAKILSELILRNS